jgi:hypothetical protein
VVALLVELSSCFALSFHMSLKLKSIADLHDIGQSLTRLRAKLFHFKAVLRTDYSKRVNKPDRVSIHNHTLSFIGVL